MFTQEKLCNFDDNYTLELVKGYDKNNVPFSAFILCNDEEKINLTKNERIDLTKYNIIYKILGHKIDQKVIDSIIEYTIKMSNLNNKKIPTNKIIFINTIDKNLGSKSHDIKDPPNPKVCISPWSKLNQFDIFTELNQSEINHNTSNNNNDNINNNIL